ncbi:hypothetical protein IQ266_02305 [filamentous cyanobacterium LEGE 11480]|uniref:Uncharacterized protein n=1 Tax=Romeriopsis navalis LEGE 11480 TaxID=2777977 RepID=A0A928VH99_9CYAN|nr:hypothetical protein [Romeriopsis navalis]MBE9028588.1 hypothetical protein [Romeriopsis navalis LEGE 11480]
MREVAVGFGRCGKYLGLMLVSVSLVSGCSVEKARTLQAAAAQFRNESLAAIAAIDNLRQRELEPPPRNAGDTRQETIRKLLNSKSPLNAELIELALNPYQPPRDREWEAFMTDLQSQYDGFAAIFDRLEGGAVVGNQDVQKSAEYARTLTVQMALFAEAIQKNPPVLVRHRSWVIANLRRVRRDYQAASSNPTRQNTLENQTGELLTQWQRLRQEERQILEATVRQCAKAVAIGKDVIELADRYDDLSLNEISLGVSRILTTASSLTGRDYSRTQSRLNRLIGDFQTDPFWQPVTRELFDRVNTAANRRNPSVRALELPSSERSVPR